MQKKIADEKNTRKIDNCRARFLTPSFITKFLQKEPSLYSGNGEFIKNCANLNFVTMYMLSDKVIARGSRE